MRLPRFGTTPLAWWLKLGINRQARHDGPATEAQPTAPTNGGHGFPRCIPPAQTATTGGSSGRGAGTTPATPPGTQR